MRLQCGHLPDDESKPQFRVVVLQGRRFDQLRAYDLVGAPERLDAVG